jgi:hypothetical protein
VRELEPQDLAVLQAPGRAVVVPQATLQTLRSAHHRLAQALAQGLDTKAVALMTGYSVGRISVLATRDPSFMALVDHYREVQELKFAELAELMSQLGRTTLEELQEQMDERPESFTTQQKMDLFELMAKGRGGPLEPRSQAPMQGPGAGAGGVTVNVKFVTPGEAPGTQLTIEGESTS